MPLKSTSVRYGTVPVAIHWLSAVMIAALLVSGFRLAGTTDLVAKAGMLRVHAAVGLSLLVLTLVRIGWWLLVDRAPEPPAGWSTAQTMAAKAVHGLLYVAIFGMIGSGMAMMMLSGAGAIVFGDSTAALPDFTAYLPRIPHGLGALAIAGLVTAHVAAALYHQLVRRDRVLARIGAGR